MSWYLGSFEGGDYQYHLYTRYAYFKNKYLGGGGVKLGGVLVFCFWKGEGTERESGSKLFFFTWQKGQLINILIYQGVDI